MTVDSYGLSSSVLGPHPDEFFGAIGRIVCVCAVLEQQLIALRHAMQNVEQGKFTHQPVGRQIEVARSLTGDLPTTHAASVTSYLDRASEAFAYRNVVVHSAFPAQAEGVIWGHRPTRSRDVTDGSADSVQTSLAELNKFIGGLSKLAEDFNGVFAVCAARR
jgi:hypothetical protein